MQVLWEQILSLVIGLEKYVRGWISPLAWKEQLHTKHLSPRFNPLYLGNNGHVVVSLNSKRSFHCDYSASVFVPGVQEVPKNIFMQRHFLPFYPQSITTIYSARGFCEGWGNTYSPKLLTNKLFSLIMPVVECWKYSLHTWFYCKPYETFKV